MADQIRAEEVRVGDMISMQTTQYWQRWGYVTKIGKSSTGATIYFSGETDQGVWLHRQRRAISLVERRGHRKPKASQ